MQRILSLLSNDQYAFLYSDLTIWSLFSFLFYCYHRSIW